VYRRVEPEYPAGAISARVSGDVVLSVEVDKEGRVFRVSVVKGLPLGLGREAARAVEKWRVDPATVNRKSVAETIEITVHFAAPKVQQLQVFRKLRRPSCGPLTADHEPRAPNPGLT